MSEVGQAEHVDAGLRTFAAVTLGLASFCCLLMILPGLMILGGVGAGLFSADATTRERLWSVLGLLLVVNWIAGPMIGWVLFGDRRHGWAIAMAAWLLASSVGLFGVLGSLGDPG